MKSVRIITSLKEKEDRQVCFQGSIDKNNIAIIDDILGYREEGLKELLSEKIRYIDEERARHLRDSRQLRVSSPDASVRRDEPSEKARLLRERRLQSGAAVQPNEPSKKARLLRNHANYTGDQTDAIVQPNEPSSTTSSIYSAPSQANYSKKLENVMDAADKKFENKKDKVVSSLRDMGVKVTEHKRRDNESQYIDVHLDNGSTIYVRASDHPARTRIDVSIEKDWKAGTRFIYEQVKQNDWATAENPYWQGDAKLRFSRKEKTENIIKEADRKIDEDLNTERNAALKQSENDRNSFIKGHLADFSEGENSWIFNPKSYPFVDFDRSIVLNDDGDYDVYADGDSPIDSFSSLDDAKRNIVADFYDSQVFDPANYETESDSQISTNRRKFVEAVERLGFKVKAKQKAFTTSSEYIWLEMPNGEEMKVRFADHQNTHDTDISVEKSWKEAVRYVVSVAENWSQEYKDTVNEGDALRFSRPEKQSAQGKREYQQKKAREEITSKSGRIIQATTDAFAPLAALERVIYGKIRGAEKSAWKMALMTKNLDQVMFHLLRVGAIKYNKADGSFTTREGTKGLEEILKPIKGKAYKNFEHYAKAKSAFERWAFLRKKKPFEKLSFADLFGFTIEDAKKWIAEASDTSKQAFADLQVFFQSQRDFMLETELITPEQHAALSKFKNYVPFFREGKDLEKETEEAYERYSEIFPGGKGFSGRSAGIEKFIGSSRKTKNLVENIMNQARRTMDSGYKNIAAYRALNLMRKIDMAKYVRSDSVDARVKIAELRRALEAEGIDVGNISDDDLLRKVPVEAYLDLVNDKNDNIVSVRVGGTLRFYKVETLRSKEPSNTSAETSSLERASTISLARKF